MLTLLKSHEFTEEHSLRITEIIQCTINGIKVGKSFKNSNCVEILVNMYPIESMKWA